MANQIFLDKVVLRAGQFSNQADARIRFASTAKHPWKSEKNSSLSNFQSIPYGPDLSTNGIELAVISSAPAFVACCVLLFRAFQHVQHRPGWLQRFVDERTEGQKSLVEHRDKQAPPYLPEIFLVLSMFGMITQVTTSLLHRQDLTPLPRALTWVINTQSLPYRHAENPL